MLFYSAGLYTQPIRLIDMHWVRYDETRYASLQLWNTDYPDPWPQTLTDWPFRKLIYSDAADLSDDLENTAIQITLGADADFANSAQADGDDFIVYHYDGQTFIPHNIVSYNSSTGALTLKVLLPKFYASWRNSFYIYYGNPDSVNQETDDSGWGAAHTASSWSIGAQEEPSHEDHSGLFLGAEGLNDRARYLQSNSLIQFRYSADNGRTYSAWGDSLALNVVPFGRYVGMDCAVENPNYSGSVGYAIFRLAFFSRSLQYGGAAQWNAAAWNDFVWEHDDSLAYHSDTINDEYLAVRAFLFDSTTQTFYQSAGVDFS